jgi:hypothetical protein
MNDREKKPAGPVKKDDRRSGLNRRWINAPYRGIERRSGEDRRTGLPPKDLVLPEIADPKTRMGFEKLLVSATLQLEAITRLLLGKGLVDEAELHEMLQQVQTDYQNQNES